MLMHPFRRVVRPLFQRPAFSLVVILTLAVGLGANTAIFSWLHGVLLQPLPYPDADRLVTVWEDHTLRGGPEDEWTGYSTFRDWREGSRVWEAIAAYSRWAPNLVNPSGGVPPEQLTGLAVTRDWFQVLGIAPEQGREFTPAEDGPEGENVVVLSHSLWQARFPERSEIVGETVPLDGESYTVVGVMPARYEPLFPGVEIWRPLSLDPSRNDRGAYFIQVVGRLKPGISLDAAHGDMDRVATQIAELEPAAYENVGVRLIPLQERLVGAAKPAILALTGAVALLLLVACANVANLLLVHAVSRRQEMAVRASLGAGRGRLARQLVAECMLLAVAGGAAGLLLAWWGTKLLVAMAPSGTPRIDEVAMSPIVILFALALSGLTGLAFGVAPALRGSRLDLADVLRPGGRVEGAGQGRLRATLVVAETALALCLLVGAGLFAKSFWGLTRVDLGFDPEGVVTTSVRLTGERYEERSARVQFWKQLTQALEDRGDILHAAASTSLPMGGAGSDFSYFVEGTEPPPEGHEPGVWYRMVTPEFFDTLGIDLVAGEPFDGSETRDDPRVVVVSQRFADRWFPGESAIGRRMKSGSHTDDSPWMTIVAVVADVRDRSPMLPTRDDVYLPASQYGPRQVNVSVVPRQGVDVGSALREELFELDASLPMTDPVRLSESVSASLWLPRLAGQVVSVFATAALALASLGIYGVLAHAVVRRRKEMGIRAALGADRAGLVLMVLRQGLGLAALGLVAGLGLALLLTKILSSALEGLLHGVEATDPVVLGATASVLLLAAGLASWLPARRASRADPAVCLREE
ncbi:MAG: ABC transporter permease [Thermoanaerobaculia bacterium]|nr:ABC transporter permease [Thermoanaerobaculia bacterium]